MASLADPRYIREDAAARAYRDMWLSEMGACVPELPRDVRAGIAAVAQLRNEHLDVD